MVIIPTINDLKNSNWKMILQKSTALEKKFLKMVEKKLQNE